MHALVLVFFFIATEALAVDEVPAGRKSCRGVFNQSGGGYDFVRAGQRETADVTGMIRKIYITNLDVFDESNPKEDKRLYRLANRIHIETRADLIRKLLLFREGEPYSRRLADESERLLRNRTYLYDADIRVVRVCEGEIDLEVVTRDTWSLGVGVSVDRSGGENEYSIGVRDTNLFGSGTTLSVRTKREIERNSIEFAYKNKNLGGSRVVTNLAYSDNDDGSQKLFGISLPFYAFDVRRAWAVFLEESDRVDTQYFRGDDITEVRREAADHRASYGFSRGLRNSKVHRWSFGAGLRKFEYSEGDELPPPDHFPQDKKLVYPFLEFSAIEDRFERRVNLDQIYRTEDLNVGYKVFVRAGYASGALGSDADRALIEGAYSDTFIADEKNLLEHELEWRGFYNFDTSEEEDVVVRYALRYLYSRARQLSYLVRFEGVYSSNLDTSQQVVLGGQSGARAFDNRFQVGDRKLLLTLERRRFTDHHFFNLVRMGWAVFFDVGRAWDPEVDDPFEDDYLANIGIGLRFTSSKANKGRFLHIDLAFPLTNRDDEEVSTGELAVRLTNRF